MNASTLHITAAASPNVELGNPRLLAHDLRLVKSSILYGDRVKLCSGTAWLSANIFEITDHLMTDRERINYTLALARAVADTHENAAQLVPALTRFAKLLKRSPLTLTKKERIEKNRIRKIVLDSWESLRIQFLEATETVGLSELQLAAGAGLLELHPFSNPFLRTLVWSILQR